MLVAVCVPAAAQTKIDFTMYGGAIFAAFVVLMLFGFILWFFRTPFMNTLYAALGAIIFCVYIGTCAGERVAVMAPAASARASRWVLSQCTTRSSSLVGATRSTKSARTSTSSLP